MPKVTITALPRQGGHKGFGAIQHYFVSGQPETLDVTDADVKELSEDPASYFLKVEDADVDEPSKPSKARAAEISAAEAAAKAAKAKEPKPAPAAR